jgi:photosystem II stability/assembly factor-like uncharacterized protein
MSSNGDDELERRLRDVLRSGALGVPVPPDAIDHIHAGARRRQQRRTGASALGAVAIIAIAAIAIGVRPHTHGTTVAAKVSAASSSPFAPLSASPVPLPVIVSESPGVASSPPVAASSAPVAASSVPVVASTPPVQVFNPVSISAVGINDYWVLGYITADSGPDGITIMKTTDAGQHFAKVGNPSAFVAQMLAITAPDTPIVSDIRFGDTNNGWVYGGSFFATRDGGMSWSAVTGVPGNVVDLAAASGNVWAVSNTTNTSSYSLYHATYGSSGTGTWTKVPLGTSIIGQPGLAVVEQNAFLLAQVGNGQGETYVIAGDGKSLVSRPAPCASSGNTISVAGDGALWIRCSGDNTVLVFVSNDQAVHWQAVSAAAVGGSIGGVDATHVLVEDTDGLHLISTAGDSQSVPYATPTTSSLPGFIGFTTTKVGFIVTDGTGAQLWRTTDGGQTWTVVTF